MYCKYENLNDTKWLHLETIMVEEIILEEDRNLRLIMIEENLVQTFPTVKIFREKFQVAIITTHLN